MVGWLPRLFRRYGSGWTHYPIVTTAGLRSVMSEHVRWDGAAAWTAKLCVSATRRPCAPTSSARPCGPPAPARHVPNRARRESGHDPIRSQLETGCTMPTIGVLERLAAARSADLVATGDRVGSKRRQKARRTNMASCRSSVMSRPASCLPLVHTGKVMSSPGSSQVTRSLYGDLWMIASAGPRSCWKCDQPS